MSSEIFSVLVLAAISLFVVSNQFSKGHSSYRVLILIITTLFLLPAVLYLIPENGNTGFDKLLLFSFSLENTLAYALLILLFWGLTMLLDIGPWAILITAAISGLLLWATWDPKWRPLQMVIRSFFVLFAMFIAIYGLIRKQKNGLWMVISLISLAFALKPTQLIPFMGAFESHNYLKAIAMFCAGKAISSGNRLIFGR